MNEEIEPAIRYLDFFPSNPESVAALSDLAALDHQLEPDKSPKSSWLAGHPRAAALIVALGVTIPTVSGGLTGALIEKVHHDRHLAAATMDENCLDLVNKNLRLGAATAIVRLSSLSTRQQLDCGFHATAWDLVDPLEKITLPSPAQLASEEQAQLTAAASPEYVGWASGAALGFAGGAFLATLAQRLYRRRRLDQEIKYELFP